jgi:hypothetical protein
VTAARARLGDPDTSHAAAGRASQRMTEKMRGVEYVLAEIGPATHERLVVEYRRFVHGGEVVHQTEQSIRSRCAELVRRGRVVDTGEKRRMVTTGGLAKVWAVAE